MMDLSAPLNFTKMIAYGPKLDGANRPIIFTSFGVDKISFIFNKIR